MAVALAAAVGTILLLLEAIKAKPGRGWLRFAAKAALLGFVMGFVFFVAVGTPPLGALGMSLASSAIAVEIAFVHWMMFGGLARWMTDRRTRANKAHRPAPPDL